MKIHSLFLSVGLTALASYAVAADSDIFYQACSDDYNAKTNKQAHFISHGDGSITDKRSGLTWQICAVGQQWNGNGCDLDPEPMTWLQAMQYAEEATESYSDQWRLPTAKEWMSIVEYRCFSPAYNKQVFPNSNFIAHWSSTFKSDHIQTEELDFPVAISMVELSRGTSVFLPADDESKTYLRLVRDAD